MAGYQQDSSFLITRGEHPNLPRTLKARLLKERADKMETLRVAQDWPDFTGRRGQLVGLEIAISLCEQVEKEFN